MDDDQRSRGLIVVHFAYSVDGRPIPFRAVFPALYPSFRFELYAPELGLKHHQNPFAGNLCLVGASTSNWKPSDNVAGFLETQLPQVLSTGRSDDAADVVGFEEPQAEPVTTYYTYESESLVLVDSAWRVPMDVTSGTLTIGVERVRPLRGGVLRAEFFGDGAALDGAIASRFPESLQGRWFRMPGPTIENDAERLLAAVGLVHPAAMSVQWRDIEGGSVDVTAVVFPEESAWRENGDGWLFVVRRRAEVRSRATRRAAGDWLPPPRPTTALVRAGRYGREDQASRVPALTALSDRTVSLVGTGAIGAPVALDLARAGIGMLRLLDGDHVEAGTGVRWPLGLDAAGLEKVGALTQHMYRNWPYTKVMGTSWRLGTAAEVSGDELEILEQLLNGSDLVLDATAELGVQAALSDLARERGISYILSSATRGAWGGIVARFRPDGEACWYCLSLTMEEGAIEAPPEDPVGEVQTVGCASPTFTGTSFDLAPVSAMATRMVAMTLAPASYGSCDWDVAVYALRDADGAALAGCWTSYRLSRHARCDNHQLPS